MGKTVVSKGGPVPVTAVNLDPVAALIRKQVVAKAVNELAAQQGKLKSLVPSPKNPDMHHVSEGFVGAVVRKAASQGLLEDIIALIVRELIALFNKPAAQARTAPAAVKPTAARASGKTVVSAGS